MTTNKTDWTPSGWRARDAVQMPVYDDADALHAVEARLSMAAPVIAIDDARALRARMADVAAGRSFLLQGGDCAENFDDAVAQRVDRLSRLFDAMRDILAPALARDIVAVARIAGQFAKPRSDPFEQRGAISLPAYRGDIVNAAGFSAAGRRPDPARMLRAHAQSVGTAATLAAARHGAPPVFTSHEALLLPYEQALVRSDGGEYWATSGHMVWLGERTRDPDGAHAHFLSGIENVVGVKCGPTMTPDELTRLCARLDPEERPGKLVLIGRFGAQRIDGVLPALLDASAALPYPWVIDPMHGNSEMQSRKYRRYENILMEIERFFACCRTADRVPGGIHLEMSPDDVTECLGGGGPTHLSELGRAYRTACDPRLNRDQSLRLAQDVAALA